MTGAFPVARLHQALRAAGTELTATELAEILWLAGRLPARDSADPAPPTESARPSEPPASPAADALSYPAPDLPSSGTDVYAAAGEAPDGGGAVPVLVRVERALPTPRRIARALRPLKRSLPSLRAEELDETSTVDLVAETGVLDLVLRPSRERWLDVALVVDDGLSMHIWQELSLELVSLLQSAGIFRRVRTYGLDSRHPDGPRLYSRPFASAGSVLPARSVCPVDGRGVVLVLSDTVGAGWAAGLLDPLLAMWARSCATAVLQPLPPRLWPGAGLRTETKLLHGGGGAAANAAWQVTDPVLPADLAPFTGLPLPVLELRPPAISSWAEFVAVGGLMAARVAGVRAAGAAGADGYTEEPVPSPVAGRVTDMRSRLALFRGAASPEAFRLAGHLAAVRPLTLPVMRLVQRSVLGGASSQAHLAEVLLGGLMRRSTRSEPPGLSRYEFRPGLRELLLESIPAGAAIQTATMVAERLRYGTDGGRYAPALQAATAGTRALPPGAGAFGAVDHPLLGHFSAGAPTPGAPRYVDVPFDALAGRDPGLSALVAEGNWRDAVVLGEQVMERLLIDLGPEHPDVLGGRHDLAQWIGEAGAPQSALRLCRELLSELLARLGPEHHRVLALRAKVAHWQGRSGDWAAAVARYQELLSDQEALLGPDNLDCLYTRHQIAFWTAQGRGPHAGLALYQDLLPRQERIRGPEDLETLRTRANIASWTGLSGRSAEALELWRALLPDMRRVLGPDHQLALVCEAEIGHWTAVNGDPAAALRLIPPVVPRLSEAMGPYHSTPYGFRRRIAQWTGESGDVAGAVELLRALLVDLGRWQPPEHWGFLGARVDFAYWTVRLGDRDTGMRLLGELLPELDQLLGSDHPETRRAREMIAELREGDGPTHAT